MIALLYNNTIEIHSYETQELVQLINLPILPEPNSFQPRSLSRAWPGIDIGGSPTSEKTKMISIPLIPLFSSAPPTPNPSPKLEKEERQLARTLLLGKNSLYALVPLTLVAQAEALIEKDRLADALSLINQIESSGSNLSNSTELSYILLRLAFLSLHSLLFQDSFDLFLKSSCDPRIVIRMFTDLRDPLITADEIISIPAGLEFEIQPAKTIDDYSELFCRGQIELEIDNVVIVLASLTRNYSPHLMPDIESATATSQLRVVLSTTARDCVRVYLSKWRILRREGKISVPGDSRKVDMVRLNRLRVYDMVTDTVE